MQAEVEEVIRGVMQAQAGLPVTGDEVRDEDLARERALRYVRNHPLRTVALLPVQVKAEGGLSLGARPLYEIVKGLPAGPITLKRTDNDWAEITAGNARYKLVGMSDRDYPRLPDHREVTFTEVSASAVVDMIGKTLFAVSPDDSRHHLSGIYLESDGERMRMVATDGHRLCKVERELGAAPTLERGVIIPRKGVAEIRRLLESAQETADLGLTADTIFVRARDVVLSVKLVDAQFPPYDQVIPKGADKSITAPRQALLDTLKRVDVMAPERSHGVRFELSKGRLRVISDNPDLGEAREDLDVVYDREDLVIGFNARYFIDVLGEIDEEEVVVELTAELDPGLIRPASGRDYLGVVMPMRI